MHEIARVSLENEMDLILAHRRSMKLGELTGLSLSAQTTFATAVSEVSRNAIENSTGGKLVLGIETHQRDKYIVASITDQGKKNDRVNHGLEYAKKLVNKFSISEKDKETSTALFYYISASVKIDYLKLDEWRNSFRNEAPLTPYEELKRKNEQLQELADRLQKSEAQYKTLAETLPLVIFSMATDGALLYANEWLINYTGLSLESLNTTRWTTVVHEEDYKAFGELLNRRSKESNYQPAQLRLKNKKNEYVWHQVSVSPLHDENGKLQYWIGYVVDIHAQKLLEETLRDNIELKVAQEKLKENQSTLEVYIEELNRSNYELQQFAFVASHDLQEPVRKLLYYSDYLMAQQSSVLSEKASDYLLRIQTSAMRMRNLIQDLLLFSQINKKVIEFKAVDLNEIYNEAKSDLQLVIDEKNATVTVQPLPVIHADPRMMRQLFQNLISNSLKYSKKSITPQIGITWEQKESFMQIAFSDNGIGFDEKYLPQMFTLFQRLNTRENYEGTGLGLAICRKIIEMHKGKIWAESKEGEGAIFYVSLPSNKLKN